MDSVPLVARMPLQPPEAVQLVVFVEFHDKADEPPVATLAGLVASVIVGGGGGTPAVTVTDWLVEPPAPVQVNVYVDVADSAPVDSVPPPGAFAPLQAPEATQLEASVEPHVRLEALPAITVAGLADNETVGAGGLTVTVTVWLTDPLGPVHVSVKPVVAVSGAEVSLPVVALALLHPPDAAQLVAFVELQSRVALPPLVTAAGFAVSVTVVTGGATVTSTFLVALPPEPEQVSPKLVDAVNAAVDSLPDVGLLPAHPPKAVQVVASDEFQARLVGAPLAMLAGFAFKSTLGAGVCPADGEPPTSPIPPQPAVSKAQSRTAITERVLINKISTTAGGLAQLRGMGWLGCRPSWS